MGKSKGILANKPLSGTTSMGRIIVISGTSGGTSTDGSGAIAGTTGETAIAPGTEYTFNVDTSAKVGDIVDFDAGDNNQASGIVTSIVGSEITGSYDSNIEIAKDECVVLNGANMEGKITVSGGFVCIYNNSSVEGKIETDIPGSYVFILNTYIEGKVESTGASTVCISNSNIEGKVSLNGNLYSSVQSCTINGKLEVLNATTCNCANNTVQGNTNTPGCK